MARGARILSMRNQDIGLTLHDMTSLGPEMVDIYAAYIKALIDTNHRAVDVSRLTGETVAGVSKMLSHARKFPFDLPSDFLPDPPQLDLTGFLKTNKLGSGSYQVILSKNKVKYLQELFDKFYFSSNKFVRLRAFRLFIKELNLLLDQNIPMNMVWSSIHAPMNLVNFCTITYIRSYNPWVQGIPYRQ